MEFRPHTSLRAVRGTLIIFRITKMIHLALCRKFLWGFPSKATQHWRQSPASEGSCQRLREIIQADKRTQRTSVAVQRESAFYSSRSREKPRIT